MGNRKFTIMACGAAFLAVLVEGVSLAAPPATLDVRTMQDWTIVVAEDAIPSERYAAEEFQTFLREATGHELPIAAVATIGDNVFIGPSPALRASDLGHVMDAAYAEEELRVVVATDAIAIMGGRPRGVLYGVYQFLEEGLGVRFLAKNFTHVPRYQADDPLPLRGVLTPMDYAYRPVMSCRHVGFTDLLDTTARFQARLRVNGRYRDDASVESEWAQRVGGFNRNGLVLHNINYWLRSSPQEHPEYYAVDKDGKRSGRDQPCFSHSEVIDRITANVLKDLKHFAHGAMIPMAQEDASLCACERCQALVRQHGLDPFGGGGENWGAPLFLAINHVAREVAKARPDVFIATQAYAASAKPPKDLVIEPNVRIQYATYNACQLHPFGSLECPLNLQYEREIKEWNRNSTGMMYWYYGMGSYTDFFAPPVTLRMAGTHLRTLIANEATSIFVQGDPIVFSDLVQYVYARLLWDPRLDSYDVIHEFVDLYYGKAAAPVAEFLRLADNEVRRHTGHPNCNAPDIHANYGYTEELGWKGIELFGEALNLADTPELRTRVEKASLAAYRLALGGAWIGKTPDGLNDERRAKLRKTAGTLFALCDKLGVQRAHEARRVTNAEAAVRKALGLGEKEPF